MGSAHGLLGWGKKVELPVLPGWRAIEPLHLLQPHGSLAPWSAAGKRQGHWCQRGCQSSHREPWAKATEA